MRMFPTFLATTTLVLSALLPSPLLANCEVGAYMIHTVADYILLDEGRRWFFAYEIVGEDLLLFPTSAHTDDQVLAMAAFLRGPHRGNFRLAFGQDTVTPDIDRPGAVFVGTDDSLMERHYIQLKKPHPFPDSLARQGYLHYDRDTKTARLATALEVSSHAMKAETLADSLTEKIVELGLHADQGSSAVIERADIERVDLQVLKIGTAGFRMIVAVLHLGNLDRLIAGNGYHTPEPLHGKLAEFPVIFWQRGGSEPFYVADGSWCAGYRLTFSTEETIKNLGPMERFVLSAAYDLDADETPDVFVVNETVAYYLTKDDEVLVIDWQLGC